LLVPAVRLSPQTGTRLGSVDTDRAYPLIYRAIKGDSRLAKLLLQYNPEKIDLPESCPATTLPVIGIARASDSGHAWGRLVKRRAGSVNRLNRKSTCLCRTRQIAR